MSSDSHGTVFGDLRYLVDELEALKYLIDIIPVYERPGNELSVCEHIRLIHFVQDKISSKFFEHYNSSHQFLSLEGCISEFKRQRSDIQSEIEKGVQHYINKLIHARVGLLNTLHDNTEFMDDYRLKSLNLLIKLERTIFKEMAEKVLAINKES